MSDNQLTLTYTENKTTLLQIINWLTKSGPNLLNSIFNAGLAITGVIITLPKGESVFSTGFIILLVFGVGTIYSNCLIWKRDNDINKYKAVINDYSLKLEGKQKIIEGYILMSSDIINNYLSVLANDTFKLTDSERISLFKYEDDTFIRIGRYSKNPVFKENGRVSYPSDQGCISYAWQKGEFFIDSLPDPERNLKNWCSEQYKQCFVPKEISKKLMMKSRNLYAFAIEDSMHRSRIAVLVIESTRINVIKQDEIRNALTPTECAKLYDLIYRMKNIVPDLRRAIEKGF